MRQERVPVIADRVVTMGEKRMLKVSLKIQYIATQYRVKCIQS
jgi:hypothetical protein